jgi:hypothetical protein
VRRVGRGWGEGCVHDNVKKYGQGGHAGIKGYALEAGARGDGRVPLFGDGLAEVDLDDEEGEVKEGASDDDGDAQDAVDAFGDESQVREEERQLETQDAGDVEGGTGVLDLSFVSI